MRRSPDRAGTLWVVSACLAGQACRYDGKAQPLERVRDLVRRGLALPVCPEQMGGLPTPRVSCERVGGRVLDADGEDRTEAFLLGAQEALALARLFGATHALLKSRSPSCGCGLIYDGTFGGGLVRGNGLFAELLLGHGFDVLTDLDLEDEA